MAQILILVTVVLLCSNFNVGDRQSNEIVEEVVERKIAEEKPQPHIHLPGDTPSSDVSSEAPKVSPVKNPVVTEIIPLRLVDEVNSIFSPETTKTPKPAVGNRHYINQICGYSNDNFIRIVDGRPAVQNKWPWMVSIFADSDLTAVLCTGSLISALFVLTTGQHFHDESRGYLVRMGDVDFNNVYEKIPPQNVRVPAENVNVFNETGPSSAIALLRLVSKARLSAAVRPICLPFYHPLTDPNFNSTGLKVFLAGWGEIDNGKPSPVLVETAQFEVLSAAECWQLHNLDNITGPAYICAGQKEGSQKLAKGDEGTSLMYQSLFAGQFCTMGVAIYTGTQQALFFNTVYFLDWIEENSDLSYDVETTRGSYA